MKTLIKKLTERIKPVAAVGVLALASFAGCGDKGYTILDKMKEADQIANTSYTTNGINIISGEIEYTIDKNYVLLWEGYHDVIIKSQDTTFIIEDNGTRWFPIFGGYHCSLQIDEIDKVTMFTPQKSWSLNWGDIKDEKLKETIKNHQELAYGAINKHLDSVIAANQN